MGYIDIYSKEDLLEKEDHLKENNPGKSVVIWAGKISLKDSFDLNIDLFKIGNFDSNYYISERVKNKIIEEKVTGCHIEPAHNLIYQ